jgi:hypothetical protein
MPVTLIGSVDQGDRARDHAAIVERCERTDFAIVGERAFA